MPIKTITHTIEYTKEDIENLIKGDIAKQLKMDVIPIIKYSINFRIGEEYDPSDWRGEFPATTVLRGATAKIEVPN